MHVEESGWDPGDPDKSRCPVSRPDAERFRFERETSQAADAQALRAAFRARGRENPLD